MKKSPSAGRPLHVRVARPEDAVRIRDLHVTSIRRLATSHYSEEQIAAWSGGRKPPRYREWMARGERMWVVTRGRQIAGFAAFSGGELHALYVHPRHVRRGAGTALLGAVERFALRRHLLRILCRSTLNAVRFYAARGFRRIERGALSFGGVRLPYVKMEKRL